jgi:hypothetical protein
MLTAVVAKFPPAVLDEYASYLLLPLVARLSAEPSQRCRAAVGAVIRQLAIRVGVRCAHDMAAFIPRWYAHDQAVGVRQCAAQLTGMLAAVRFDALSDVLAQVCSVSYVRSPGRDLSMLDVPICVDRWIAGYTVFLCPGVQVLDCATSECKRADAEHRALEASLQVHDGPSERSEAGGAAFDTGRIRTVAVRGTEDSENAARVLSIEADSRVADIFEGRDVDSRTRDLASADRISGEDDEDEVAKETLSAAPTVVSGSAGGGVDLFLSTSKASAGRTIASADVQSADETTLPLSWESLYHTLVALERIWASNPMPAEEALGKSTSVAGQSLPETVCELLLYPHAWVRLAAVRWLDVFLSRRDIPAVLGISGPLLSITSWLRSPTTCFRVARMLATQLTSPHLGPALVDHCVRCLLFLTLLLNELTQCDIANASSIRSATSGAATAGVRCDADTDDDTEKCDVGDNIRENVGASCDMGPLKATDVVNVSGLATRHDPLLRLFDRMSSIGTTGSAAATRAVLKWIAAAAVRLPSAVTNRCLPPIVRLLFRIATTADVGGKAPSGGATGGISGAYPSDVRALATEAGELIQAHVGGAVYVSQLNVERNRVAAARMTRRQDRALTRVLDPQVAAQTKAKRQAAKMRYKKRKVDEFRMMKGKPLSGQRVAADEGVGSRMGVGKRKRPQASGSGPI